MLFSSGASSRKNVREDAKRSALDVYRLWHSRLQLDHLAIHSEPATSAMVDGFGVLLRRIGPGLEHLKDEEIVFIDETGKGSANCATIAATSAGGRFSEKAIARASLELRSFIFVDLR